MFINISQVHIIIINSCILNTYIMVLGMAPVPVYGPVYGSASVYGFCSGLYIWYLWQWSSVIAQLLCVNVPSSVISCSVITAE